MQSQGLNQYTFSKINTNKITKLLKKEIKKSKNYKKLYRLKSLIDFVDWREKEKGYEVAPYEYNFGIVKFNKK